MTSRIKSAIDIFLDAINNGTLAKGNCTACAVGNLVRVGMGLTTDEYNTDNLQYSTKYGCAAINWSLIFCTIRKKQNFKSKTYSRIFKEYPLIKNQIDSTGFTVEELAKIEKAFEYNTEINYHLYNDYNKQEIRADQIKGLEAVIKVMLEFDEQPEEVFEVFTKKAELIAI